MIRKRTRTNGTGTKTSKNNSTKSDKANNKGQSYNKNKGGRPATVLTEEDLIKVEALACALTVEQIADYFGISRAVFFEIMNRQPDVSRLYKRGRSKVISDIANNLITKAKRGDNASMMFFLKTQAGWRETNNLNLSSEDGSMSPKHNVNINTVDPVEAAKQYQRIINGDKSD